MRALLLASALVALPAVAHAGLLAQYSTDGGTTFTPICSDASGGACSDTFTSSNGLDFLLFASTSNSPGTPTGATLFSTSLRLENTSGAQQTILISVGDTGFTAPIGSVTFLNNLAGTVVTGGAGNLLSSIACLDTADGQNACPATYATPTINAAITVPGAGSNTTTLSIGALAGPYSMTELISLTLDAGALLNYVSSSQVTPAPEPTTLGILGLGLLGLAAVRRRQGQ
jgi:hypothetical protein